MKYLTEVPKHLLSCSVDPITLTGFAVGALAGGGAALAAGGGGAPAPAAPAAPSAAAAPQQNPASTKPAAQSQQPSFVGQAAIPSSSYGQKTLLGQ